MALFIHPTQTAMFHGAQSTKLSRTLLRYPQTNLLWWVLVVFLTPSQLRKSTPRIFMEGHILMMRAWAWSYEGLHIASNDFARTRSYRNAHLAYNSFAHIDSSRNANIGSSYIYMNGVPASADLRKDSNVSIALTMSDFTAGRVIMSTLPASIKHRSRRHETSTNWN